MPSILAGRAIAMVATRMRGPGGLYNLGNGLGLAAGLGVVVAGATMSGGPSNSVAAAVFGHLAGSPAAVLTTLATLVFMLGGEAYHRAFAPGFAGARDWARWGDVLSGVGALVLAGGLMLLGDPVLAGASGLLHAGGKFGSACLGREPLGSGQAALWSDVFRMSVLASRLPALMLALSGLIGPPGPVQASDQILLLATIACVLLWGGADMMSLRPAGRSPAMPLRARAGAPR